MAEPYMTVEQINAKYPNEWVLVANPTSRRPTHPVTGGCVVLHSPDRAEFWRMVEAWDDPAVKHTASWYTGKDEADDIELFASEPGAA